MCGCNSHQYEYISDDVMNDSMHECIDVFVFMFDYNRHIIFGDKKQNTARMIEYP